MTSEMQRFFAELKANRTRIADTLDEPSVRGYGRSVVDKYTDRAHFIYELLQNADDAGAKQASFELSADRLVFRHNGSRHFTITDPANERTDTEAGTLGDVNAITAIANSNKTELEIGKFGVGFKAVFQYTVAPEVYDPQFAFRISRLIIPELLTQDFPDRAPEETVFVFPFDLPAKPASEARDDVWEKLTSLVLPLLFMKSLCRIDFSDGGRKGGYEKRLLSDELINGTICEHVVMDKLIGRRTASSEQLWLFSRRTNLGHRYSVGFFHDETGRLCANDLPAFCFFPTKVMTGLHFILHAPFRLTDSREGIKASDPHNSTMISKLAQLAADSLPLMREIGLKNNTRLIDSNMFDILPYDEATFAEERGLGLISFAPIFRSIRICLGIETIFPGHYGYVAAKDAWWANVPQTAQVFSDDQLRALIRIPDAHWIELGAGSQTRKNYNRQLYDFVSELGVHTLTDEQLIKKINAEYICAQESQWLRSFYQYCADSKERTAAVRLSPILFSQRGEPTSPYTLDSGNRQHENLFLPMEGVDSFNMIDPAWYRYEEVRRLAEELKLHTPSRRDEILDVVLPMYRGRDPFDDKEAFRKLYRYALDCPQRELDDLIRNLVDCPIVYVRRRDHGAEAYRAIARQVYFRSAENDAFFKTSETTPFVAGDVFEDLSLPSPEKLHWFLSLLGVNEHPQKQQRIFKDPKLPPVNTIRPYDQWPQSTNGYRFYINGIDQLELAIKEAACAEKSSSAVWSVLMYYAARQPLNMLFRGECCYQDKLPLSILFDVPDRKALMTTPWLLDREGNYHMPADIMQKDLSPIYPQTGDAAQSVISFLRIRNEVDAPDSMLSASQKNRLAIADALLREGFELGDVEEMVALYRHKKDQSQHASSKSSESAAAASDDAAADHHVPEEDLHVRSATPQINRVLKDIGQLSSSRKESLRQPVDTEEQDSDEFTKPSVDYEKLISRAKEKSLTQIERISTIQQYEEQAVHAERYSFAWLMALLNLEIIESGESESNRKAFTINFGKVSREEGTSRTLVLHQPDRYIPQQIEDLADVSLKLIGDAFEHSVAIEVVNIRSYTLRVKLKNAEQLKGIDLSAVRQATISVMNPVFLLNELRNGYAGLGLEPTNNLRDRLPKNLRFIFGPPGTGKTTHLARNVITPIMQQEEPLRILVLTPTNKAADVLTERIMDQCLPEEYRRWMIRFGTTGSARIENSGVYREKSTDIHDFPKATVITTIARFAYDYFICHDEKRLYLSNIRWDYIVIDEASMIALMFILYPILKKTPREFIIAGDPFQIQPITSVDLWKDENIYTMVRLNNFSSEPQTIPYAYPVELLMKQYRSTPSVGQIFSGFAYRGLLSHHRSQDSRKPLQLEGIIDLHSLNLIKFPVSRYESIYRTKRLQGKTPYQVYSALFTFEFVHFLSKKLRERNPGKRFSIGIIAPYRAQADLIEKLVASMKKPPNIDILVGTIHGFQGDECDIVLAVFNPPPKITSNPNMFLNKRNIINVAISRARDYLIVVMPDNDTEDIGELTLVNRVEALCLEKHNFCHTFTTAELETMMFGRPDYLQINSFSTSHQAVNVYGLPEQKYEIRSEDTAVDVQIHDLK